MKQLAALVVLGALQALAIPAHGAGKGPAGDAATLVRTARSVVPACALGHLGRERPDPLLAEEILAEVQLVFEFLGLGPVEARV